MKNLVKNILRYTAKNKFSMLGLGLLMTVTMTSATTLGLLSHDITTPYESVIMNGNQHNIVMNELYSSGQEGQANKQKVLDLLTSKQAVENGLNARRYEGLRVQSDSNTTSLVVDYEPKYASQYNSNFKYFIPDLNKDTLVTDNLQVFAQTGLPFLEANFNGTTQKFYHLPNSIDFPSIINYVTQTYSENLTGPIANLTVKQKEILAARQTIIYFLSKSLNYKTTYVDFMNNVYNETMQTIVETVDPKSVKAVNSDFAIFFDVNNKKYNQPITDGFSINFQSSTASKVLKFEDYTSRLCVTTPSLLKYRNKEVFSYNEYKKILNNNSLTKKLYDKDTLDYAKFQELFNQIPSKYKINIDNIDYLIVGAGITPDLFYPIISMQSVVVNFADEQILYTNNNGFKRSLNSFQSSPLETLMLINYSGGMDLNAVVNNLQKTIATKYLSFPSSTKSVFLADDENNIFSPTALRVNFCKKLILTINIIAVVLSIFLALISLFIIVVILNKFITENIKNFYILIAQGVSKVKTVFTILLMPLFPILFASIVSYLISYFIQPATFNLFSPYWSIGTYTSPFQVWVIILLFISVYLASAIVVYTVSFIRLSKPVSEGLNTQKAKVGWLAKLAKKGFPNANVKTKFRLSLAFGSFGKLFVLSFTIMLFSICVSFIGSTIDTFNTSLANVVNTNKSLMKIDLTTPTRNGGQYYASSFKDAGQIFRDANGNVINPPNFVATNPAYESLYNSYEPFKQWANMTYISVNDLTNQKQDLEYLSNKTNWRFLMDINLPLGAPNPWTDIAAPLLPANQSSATAEFDDKLSQQLLADNVMIRTSNKSNNSIKDIYNNEKAQIDLSVQSIYIVDDSVNYILNSGVVLPVIHKSTINNIDTLTDSQIIDQLINLYPEQFDNTIKPNLKLIRNKDNIEIKANTPTVINYVSNRILFEKFFAYKSSYNNFYEVYDPILLQNRKFAKQWNNGIFSISKLNKSFICFCTSILNNDLYQKNIYKNTYNSAILNPGDEPYAFVDATINSKIDSKYDNPKNIKITGIIPNSKFISLMDNDGNNLNELLNQSVNTENTYPLVINVYAQKLYNLNLNDTITVFANNNVDRFDPNLTDPKSQYYQQYINRYTTNYKVVGICNSTKGAEFYTNITATQNSVGLSHLDNNNQQVFNSSLDTSLNSLYSYNTQLDINGNNPKAKYSLRNLKNSFGGFNGVFIKDDLSSVSNDIQLYSPSSLYPGLSEFNSSNVILRDLIKYNLFKNKNKTESINRIATALYLNHAQFNQLNATIQANINNTANQDLVVSGVIDQLSKIYRKTIYYSVLENPTSINVEISTFQTITTIVSNISLIVVILISVICIIIIFMIGWIIIKDLTNLIVILKVLGVSDWSNSLNMFSIFIPTWIISCLVSLPFTYLAINLFTEFVFLKMGLYLFTAMNWWAIILIFIGVAAFLAIMIVVAKQMIKKINLVECLKW